MGAEHHYLNAVEAYDEGDAETAYEEAYKAVSNRPNARRCLAIVCGDFSPTER